MGEYTNSICHESVISKLLTPREKTNRVEQLDQELGQRLVAVSAYSNNLRCSLVPVQDCWPSNSLTKWSVSAGSRCIQSAASKSGSQWLAVMVYLLGRGDPDSNMTVVSSSLPYGYNIVVVGISVLGGVYGV